MPIHFINGYQEMFQLSDNQGGTFTNIFISKDGKILNWFSSMTSPTSEGLTKAD